MNVIERFEGWSVKWARCVIGLCVCVCGGGHFTNVQGWDQGGSVCEHEEGVFMNGPRCACELEGEIYSEG